MLCIIAIAVLIAPDTSRAASKPACNPNVSIGHACSTVGQTAMDCQSDNVLYCLHLQAQTQGTGQWYIAGTDTIPTCAGYSALDFNGTLFECVPISLPTCSNGTFLTSLDGYSLTCCAAGNITCGAVLSR